jgi:hypothetical protein
MTASRRPTSVAAEADTDPSIERVIVWIRSAYAATAGGQRTDLGEPDTAAAGDALRRGEADTAAARDGGGGGGGGVGHDESLRGGAHSLQSPRGGGGLQTQ